VSVAGVRSGAEQRLRPRPGLPFPVVAVEALGRVGEVDVGLAGEGVKDRLPDLLLAAAALARVAGGLGSPIKGCPSRAKTFPEHEIVVFMLCCVPSPTSLPLPIFLSASMSAFAAPVTHQDQGGCGGHRSSTALSAFRGPENLRFQAVSKWLFQDSWLLASPLVVHGVGSKDGDNRYLCWAERLPIRPRGFANPNAGSPLRPVPKRRSFPA
jgi:hypothetical protein